MLVSTVAAAIVILAVAGCTPTPAQRSQARPDATAAAQPPAAPPALAIQAVSSAGVRYDLPVQPTERVADGATTIVNAGATKVQLVNVEPVFTDRPAGEPVLGIHVVRRSLDEQAFGIARTYPPPDTVLGEVPGAVLDPHRDGGARYQLVVGLNVRTGTLTLSGLRVTYIAEGVTYTRTLEHNVVLCAGRPRGATRC
jgi:hypothetical protein